MSFSPSNGMAGNKSSLKIEQIVYNPLDKKEMPRKIFPHTKLSGEATKYLSSNFLFKNINLYPYAACRVARNRKHTAEMALNKLEENSVWKQSWS
mmetsp:Transcript_6823/g.6927  ORF Transcript_6823/g.6927 Transcript_6823/m.6927 type:complete len:95 (-) Transcript_6823:41-325(-)